MKTNWKNKNILILGAARQGLALARYLAKQGANVTINDKKSKEDLKSAMESMKDFEIDWQLGHHDENLLEGKDLISVSAGIPLSMPFLGKAEALGIPIKNDSQIFMENVPCKVIGITGSVGKTTTTTLVGRMAEAACSNQNKVWVGGNIGTPLVDRLDEINVNDLVVMELSSFQLELMSISPQISALLNVTPNHLDRHKTIEKYAEIKTNIFRHQNQCDTTILGLDNDISSQMTKQVPGNLVTFGFEQPPAGTTGTWLKENTIMLQNKDQQVEIMSTSIIELRGRHNVQNVIAACAIAYAAEVPFEAMIEGVSGFGGVEHRLEYVRTYKGSKWYNDSKATTPDGSFAGIKSFTEPLVMLLGGKDKDLPWENLAKLVHERVDHVVLFGQAADKIAKALQQVSGENKPYTLDQCGGLEEAVKIAAGHVQEGDVVLLSPGGTSFDEFNNYEERGEYFKKWVTGL